MGSLDAKGLFIQFNNNVRTVKEPHRRECYFAFVYLCRGENICKMLCAIDMGLPPLNAVCKGLEGAADCSSMQVRQIVGMEIKFILSLFGYDIDDSQDRPALRKSCKGKYFKTGAFYKQVRKSQYTLNVEVGEIR